MTPFFFYIDLLTEKYLESTDVNSWAFKTFFDLALSSIRNPQLKNTGFKAGKTLVEPSGFSSQMNGQPTRVQTRSHSAEEATRLP
jgi:hypothetical protein